MGIHSHIAVQLSLIGGQRLANRKVMAAKALIVLGLAACAAASYHGGYGYSYAPQNYGYGYTIGSHGYHKREAEPSYSPALAYHPAGGYGYNKYGPGYSYTERSPQGLHKRSPQIGLIGLGLLGAGLAGAYEPKYRDINYRNSLRYYKREAEPSYAPALAYHPAGGYGYNKYGPGYSYTDRSPQGIHKREAEPSYAPALAYHPAGGYGYNKYGPGYSYTDRSPQGLHGVHKRSPQLLTTSALSLLGTQLLVAGLAGQTGLLDGRRRGPYKREAEPSYAPALAYHPAGGYGYNKYGPGYSYTDRSPQGIHKREAEPSYAPALAYHPAGGYGYNKYGPGYSYTDRSPQGIHKREAEPSYAPALAYHPAGGYGYNKYGPGYSYTDRSPQGLRVHKRSPQLLTTSALTLLGLEALGFGLAGQTGLIGGRRYRGPYKREAEPSYAPALAYHPAGGYGYNKYGPGYSYTDRSPQGLHKREASGNSYQSLVRTDCYGYNCQNTEYGVKVNGYEANVYENREGH